MAVAVTLTDPPSAGAMPARITGTYTSAATPHITVAIHAHVDSQPVATHVATVVPQNSTWFVDVPNLPRGIYFVVAVLGVGGALASAATQFVRKL